MKDAGLNEILDYINPHSLRHLYARGFNKVYPQKKTLLSQLLGHASLKTTENYLRPGD